MAWAATIVLFLACLSWPIKAGRRGNPNSFVKEFNVKSDCRPNIKNVRSLSTGAGIFYFNELTKSNLFSTEDFMCHYELEAPSGFGFHVYIDQMYLSDKG